MTPADLYVLMTCTCPMCEMQRTETCEAIERLYANTDRLPPWWRT